MASKYKKTAETNEKNLINFSTIKPFKKFN